MKIKFMGGGVTLFILCSMFIALISGCPMPEPEPTAPGTMAAPDLKAGDEELIATWTAPEDNGGSPITGYELQYRTGSGEWTGMSSGIGTNTSHSITGLTNGAAYEVQVRAVNAIGAGDWSESAAETPVTVPDAPAAPTLYAGTGRIVARWTAPEDTGGSAITGYELQYLTGGGAWTEISEGITGTDHCITGLTNGIVYGVQARAVNVIGKGPWSAPVAGTPLFSPKQTPSGTEKSINLPVAQNAFTNAIIANENLNVLLTPVKSGTTLTVEEGDLKVTPTTAPAGVTIPTVDANTGIVTVTASTTAGTYVVYGETETGNIVFAEYFSVTESPTTNAELKAAVTSGISNWGNTADFNYIITTAVTIMAQIFNEASEFNGDISLWDTSSVTSMLGMFNDASAFNGDISLWDTGAVTDMSWMFYKASVFNSNISKWDVGAVTIMSNMFRDASAFNQNLEEWKDHWTLTNGKYTGTATLMFNSSGVTTPPTWYNN